MIVEPDTEVEKPAEKMLSQSEVNAIVARETKRVMSKVAADLGEFDTLKTRLAEIEAEKAAAEEAKLSATQRQELERKREREAFEKRITELDTSAKGEREKRHQLLVEHAAAQRVSGIAGKLFNPALASTVTREISALLRVESDADGAERVVAVMGAEGDREPLETAWSKIEAERLTKFFKSEGGAGAAHGSGNAGGRAAFAGMSSTEKIAAALGRR